MKTTGNVILITGGSSGIGLETAKFIFPKGQPGHSSPEETQNGWRRLRLS